jgi:excinuclease ABC subunit C
LRDEAHRFAITHHRSIRERTIRESVLDEIPGIGPAKKRALLRKFHSTRGIGKASVEEIASTAGINAALAGQVKASCIAVGG